MQTLVDITNNYTRTEDKVAKKYAINWVTSFGNDFVEICYLAEYNPTYVYKKFMKLIENGGSVKMYKLQDMVEGNKDFDFSKVLEVI